MDMAGHILIKLVKGNIAKNAFVCENSQIFIIIVK
jgi:hypothetical protein